MPLLKRVLAFVRETPQLALVIDADGLFLLADCLDEVRQCGGRRNIVVTPNFREFERLYVSVFPAEAAGNGEKVEATNKPAKEEASEEEGGERVRRVARELGVCVVRKGESDVISDGENGKCHSPNMFVCLITVINYIFSDDNDNHL